MDIFMGLLILVTLALLIWAYRKARRTIQQATPEQIEEALFSSDWDYNPKDDERRSRPLHRPRGPRPPRG